MAAIVFTREVRGVRQAATLDAGLLASSEARRLNEHAATLHDVFAAPGAVRPPRRSKRRSPAPANCSTR